jgi:hypothetical protein
MFNIYSEYCNECEAETQYTILDLNRENKIECMSCGRLMLPCDLCCYHQNGCGHCEIQFDNAIKDAYEGFIVLDSYPQGTLPDGVDDNGSVESTEWSDSHFTKFAISKPDFLKILENLGWSYDWFMVKWTYDMSEQVYETAKGFNMEMIEKIFEF